MIQQKISLITLCFLLLSLNSIGATISGTYTAGDIPTNNITYSAACNGPATPFTVSLPGGGPWQVTSIDVVYGMTAASGAWKSEQRSKIYCQNTTTGEAAYASGAGTTGGLQNYNRAGLNIANGIYAGGTNLVFEMQAYRTWTGGGTCNTTYNKVDNGTWTITVNYSLSGPMSYVSTTVTQNNTSNIPICSSNQEIIGLEVNTSGSTSPIDFTHIRIRTDGSTNPLNDISNIDIYYTGTSSTYATTTLFGSAAPAVTGNDITINGTQTLAEGTNYFWVVYDIAGTANIGNTLDALCNRIRVNGTYYTNPANFSGSPAGSRTLAVCAGTPGGTSQTTNIWLRASSGTTPSTGTGTLTNWNNSGASGAITINGTPTFEQNGYNFNSKVHFNGNGNYLSHTGITFGSIYAMAELEDQSRVYTHLSTHDGICGGTHADGSLHGGINGPNSGYELTSYAPEFEGAGVWKGNGVNQTSTALYLGTHQIVSAVANSGDFDAYGNRLLGGQPCLPARDWLGDVSEVIVLTGTSTNNERDQIESYLAIKYGLTLGINGTSMDYYSTGHSVIWDQSVNTGYNYDITGIRRDDATELDQRKSHTEMWTGAVRNDIVTIANETNFTSPAFITVDNSSLIWGHNNGNLVGPYQSPFFNTLNPETIQSLFSRHWKGQETGTMGTVTLEFDMSVVPGVGNVAGANDLNNLRLLVDVDGNFTTGATSISPSFVDNTADIVRFQHDFVAGTGFFFTVGSINNSTTPLPVELLSFEASCQNNTVSLDWITKSEINNDFFTIEKSTDAVKFYPIAEIQGNGNSASTIEYQWTDNNPTNGTSYYRLKQTDFNGESKYYASKAVSCDNFSNISIYPNPFKNDFTIQLSEHSTYPINIEIQDFLGRTVYQKQIIDETKLISTTLEQQLPIGTYFIKVFNETNQTIEKIMKIK